MIKSIICLFFITFSSLYAQENIERIECQSGRFRNKIQIEVDLQKEEIEYKSRYDHEILPLIGEREDQQSRVIMGLKKEENMNILLQVFIPKNTSIKLGKEFGNVYAMVSRYASPEGARITAMIEDFKCRVF